MLIYVNLDVHIWLQIRKQCGRPDLTRVGDYVLASSQDRWDFEKFRDSEFYKKKPLIKSDILVQFMEMSTSDHMHAVYKTFPHGRLLMLV